MTVIYSVHVQGYKNSEYNIRTLSKTGSLFLVNNPQTLDFTGLNITLSILAGVFLEIEAGGAQGHRRAMGPRAVYAPALISPCTCFRCI